jgi:flagellin-like protein
LIHEQSKSKRGITPILATLLLIVIAVAAIVVTYAWIMTYMSNVTSQAGVNLYPVNVDFSGSAHDEISVDIQNKGTSDAHLVRIYIGTSSSTMQSQNSSSLPELCAAHGRIATITVNYNWTSGATYYFQVLAQEQTAGPWAYQAPIPPAP